MASEWMPNEAVAGYGLVLLRGDRVSTLTPERAMQLSQLLLERAAEAAGQGIWRRN